jgi:hypothetical protein
MDQQLDFTFDAVDELGLGFAEGYFEADAPLSARFAASGIGPLIELHHLIDAGVLPDSVAQAVDLAELSEFSDRLRRDDPAWICGRSGRFGIMRLGSVYGEDEVMRWTAFSIKAKAAAQQASFPAAIAGQLVGALKEMHSNIYEHSGHSQTGLVAFAARDGVFEVVVADQGMGVLQSLRSSAAYAALTSHTEALQLALQPGVSRLAEPLRGHGFDRMFTGLMNLGSTLRFRSGSGAITIEGLEDAKLVPIACDRAPIPGFVVTVNCHARANPTANQA